MSRHNPDRVNRVIAGALRLWGVTGRIELQIICGHTPDAQATRRYRHDLKEHARLVKQLHLWKCRGRANHALNLRCRPNDTWLIRSRAAPMFAQ